jgi:glutaredoxin
MPPSVLLLTRAACHLCDEARDVVASVCAEAGVAFREVDVDADAALRAEHGDFVPVVLVDGVRRGFWQIDADRLRRALG